MKRFVVGVFLLLGVQTGLAKSAQWINITPQENLQAWTRVPIPPKRPLNPASQWKVDRALHAIICEGNGGHEWLRYDRKYKDFIFEVQWRLTKLAGAKKYNSGIFVRNNRDGSIWYQAQVGSASGGYLFGDNPVHGVLERFNLRSELGENHVKPAGEWNTYRLQCAGRTLILWVNGVRQSEFTECNNAAGYIGLEAEGSRIEFRNLRVRTLP